TGIDLGLNRLKDRGDSGRGFTMHEPRHEIGAVTAEVEECARAIAGRVGEPIEEFGWDANFFGAVVAVVNHNFADVSESAVLYKLVDGGVARIPSGLVIHQDRNVRRVGGTLDRKSVVDRNGERLLHHHGNVVAGGNFYYAAMFARIGVSENRLRLHSGEHLVEISVEQMRVELVLIGVAVGQLLVGLGDADNLNVATLGGGRKKAGNVAVSEACDGNAKRLGFRLCED